MLTWFHATSGKQYTKDAKKNLAHVDEGRYEDTEGVIKILRAE